VARDHTEYTMRRHSQLLTSLLLLPLGAMLLAPKAASADDLKLKDGSTISGTIVGFEEDSFKVKTSYGFAIVLKDEVVSISISEDAKAKTKTTTEKAPAPAVEKPAVAEKKPVMATPKSDALKPIAPPLPAMAGGESSDSSDPAPAAKTEPPPAPAPTPAPEKVAAKPPVAHAPEPAPEKTVAKAVPPPSAAPAAKPTPTSAAKNSPSAPSPAAKAGTTAASAPANATSVAAAAPPKPPAPEPIKEVVNGNVYTNETYRFHMYKPPDWDVIATAPAMLPGAITAMGTGDDMTYLLIGQEPAPSGTSATSGMATTEKRLRDVMSNFRPLGEKQVTVSGAAVTEHRFRGSVDQHDWSGVVVLVPHGEKVFTIFGMTRADNDLVQIQENVIARAISSLQFNY